MTPTPETAVSRRLPPLLTALLAALLAGCTAASSPAPVATSSARGGDHGHAHERDKMLLADAGPYHAALTAHLSKDGSELDVFFETGGGDPEPVALRLPSFAATAARADGTSFPLTFEPAPAGERPPGETGRLCSHFVAKAGWMAADDVLTVTAEVEVRGRRVTVTWPNFVPRRYAHHTD